MKLKTKLSMFALLCLGAPACSPNEVDLDFSKAHFIVGQLSAEHVEELRKSVEGVDRVVINSPGGKTKYGREIGRLLYEHDLPLYITEECSSACADLVMPSAKYVVLSGNPKIRFHGNTYMRQELAVKNGHSFSAECIWKNTKWLDFIYEERGLSYDFVKLQIERVGLPTAEFITDLNGCLRFKSYAPTKRAFEPSIAELKHVWGLDVRTVS